MVWAIILFLIRVLDLGTKMYSVCENSLCCTSTICAFSSMYFTPQIVVFKCILIMLLTIIIKLYEFPSRINTMKATPRHSTVKILKTKPNHILFTRYTSLIRGQRKVDCRRIKKDNSGQPSSKESLYNYTISYKIDVKA